MAATPDTCLIRVARVLAQGGALAASARFSPGQPTGQVSIFGEEEEEDEALAAYTSSFQAARCGGLPALQAV